MASESQENTSHAFNEWQAKAPGLCCPLSYKCLCYDCVTGRSPSPAYFSFADFLKLFPSHPGRTLQVCLG